MDDKTSKHTNTSAWLAFSLAFDASARYCHHIRQSQPDIAIVGQQIAGYLLGHDDYLAKALADKIDSAELAKFTSEQNRLKMDEALHWCAINPHHHLLGLDDIAYPALLRDTSHSPPLLYAKGDLNAVNAPALAIVGSRKASRSSMQHTFELAAAMASRGVTIVSGLARGIDAAAHEGALSVGGRTIAVAATSPESIYPKQHRDLENRIIEHGGLILTEYSLGTKTLRWHFPRRNRIISGLSLGVLVAEAGLPSGTLTTATHAINQGREVMAVPGNVQNPQFRGCHSLLKQGATLVECEQDILDALAWPLLRTIEDNQSTTSAAAERENPLEHPEQLSFSDTEPTIENQILNALQQTPATIDELMTHTQVNVTELGTFLGMLEIDGKITACANGQYTLSHRQK